MSNVEAVRAAGQALFGKTYELSLVKGYVSHWGFTQAVRELIQNALDSDSPFKYEFQPEDDCRWSLLLSSEFATLTPQSLLLGATSKAQDPGAIGSFGEGYKLALLVLTREGFDVEVRNGNLIWRPYFRTSRTFGTEILAIGESTAPDRTHRGVTFIVRGLTTTEVGEVRSTCLLMQDNVGEVKSTPLGDILIERPGELYVGNLFVCTTEMRYGYNIKPEHLQLERDRETVSGFNLKNITQQLWYATGETERVANMIHEEVPDLEFARYDAPALVKEECYRIFRERHPQALIADTPAEARSRIQGALVERVYVGSYAGAVIASSRGYSTEPRVRVLPKIMPHVALLNFLSAHRSEMRRPAIVAFKALIEQAEREWQALPAPRATVGDEVLF